MRRRSRRVSKSAVFVALVFAALIAVWLPIRWTRPLTHVMQLFAPAEQMLSAASGRVGRAVDDVGGGPVPLKEHEELARTAQALQNRVISLARQVEQLEAINRELAALREGGFRGSGRLVPARVVRHDAAAWRDGVLLDRGRSSGVSDGDAVVYALSDAGTGGDGRTALTSACLVGEVVDAAPYTATVRLLSDPQSRTPVGLGRVEHGGFAACPAEFILRGVGDGRMVILDVPRKYTEAGQVRVGDSVVSGEGQYGLPVSLVIARVTRVEPDPRQPHLLDRVEVRPLLDVRSFSRVYVVDLDHAE